MRGPALTPDEYVDAMVEVAERDASIGRVLREILSPRGGLQHLERLLVGRVGRHAVAVVHQQLDQRGVRVGGVLRHV